MIKKKRKPYNRFSRYYLTIYGTKQLVKIICDTTDRPLCESDIDPDWKGLLDILPDTAINVE